MAVRKLSIAAEADALLATYVKPACLIKGEISDTCWVIKLGSGPAQTFDFDQPLTPWPDSSSLLDPEYALDLATIKILLLCAIKAKPVGWVHDASTLSTCVFKPHLVLLRWRIDQGLKRYSDLTAPWFTKFDAVMKAEAREGLLNLPSKAQALLAHLESGALTVEFDKRGHVRSKRFAQLLGLSAGHAITGTARRLIEQYFRSKGIAFSRRQKRRTFDIVPKSRFRREGTKMYYRPWLDLWRLRDQLSHDPIGYRAFSNMRELNRWVKSWTAVANRTPDAPAYQTSCLVNASLKLILSSVCSDIISVARGGIDFRGEVNDLDGLTQINKRLGELGFPKIGTRYNKNGWCKSDAISVREFLYLVIVGAARIVISAFTARRDGEISRLNASCIERGNNGEYWMHSYILKNHNRTERIPVPASVERAVEVIVKIRNLGHCNTETLFNFQCPISCRNVSYDFGKNLDFISSYLGVPPLEDGTFWHFTPHQFRKFFGITYFWRWAFPNLTALTFHFRHFNAETTVAYLKLKAAEGLRIRDEKSAAAWRKLNAERMTDLQACGRDFVIWVSEAAIRGELLGPLARRINDQISQLKEKFLPELQVTAAAADVSYSTALSTLIGCLSIQVHPEGHSLCGCGESAEDARISQCRNARAKLADARPLEAGPAFGFADEENCLKCGHRGQLKSMSPYWEQECEAAQRALHTAKPDQALMLKERVALITDHALF